MQNKPLCSTLSKHMVTNVVHDEEASLYRFTMEIGINSNVQTMTISCWKRSTRNLLPDDWITCRRSGEKVSLFFSRKPDVRRTM